MSTLLKVKSYNDLMLNRQKELENEVAEKSEDLRKALEQIRVASLDTVYRLARAAEYRDDNTGAHVQRISHYASAIARSMGLGNQFVEQILWASPMHDIGKIGIPDHILQKPGQYFSD